MTELFSNLNPKIFSDIKEIEQTPIRKGFGEGLLIYFNYFKLRLYDYENKHIHRYSKYYT